MLDLAMLLRGDLIGWKDFGSYDDLKRDLPWKKYAQELGEKDDAIPTSKLKYTDEIVRKMAQSGSYWSIRTLEKALELKRALIEKHKTIDASLDEILGAR